MNRQEAWLRDSRTAAGACTKGFRPEANEPSADGGSRIGSSRREEIKRHVGDQKGLLSKGRTLRRRLPD